MLLVQWRIYVVNMIIEHIGRNDEGLYDIGEEDGADFFTTWEVNYANFVPDEDVEKLEENLNEEEVNDDVHCEPVYVSNLRNLKIEVGATFGSQTEFRKALRQYEILNEFEFHTDKSEQKRFRAICNDYTCKWRIAVARLQDNVTYQIRKLPIPHTCKSIRKASGRMAITDWILLTGWSNG